MTTQYFKENEVMPYEPLPPAIPAELQGATIIESKTASVRINGVPDNTYTENPLNNIYGILQNPDTKKKWYSLERVVKKINGTDEYDDNGQKMHKISIDIVGLKKKKTRDVVLKKAHQLNNGSYIKTYKVDHELYIHEELLRSLIKYYRNENPNLTSKKSSDLKSPSLVGFKNVLIDTVLTDRTRTSDNNRNKKEKLQIIDELKVLNKEAPTDLLDSVYSEIVDIIIKNDDARNKYISNRIDSEFNNAIATKEKDDDLNRNLLNLYQDAFDELYSKVTGIIRVKGSNDFEERQKEFINQRNLYGGGIQIPEVANRVFLEARNIKKQLDNNVQRLSEKHYLK